MSATQKSMPSRKLGVEMPMTEAARTSGAVTRPRPSASRIPSGTPRQAAMPMATSSRPALRLKKVSTSSAAGQVCRDQ